MSAETGIEFEDLGDAVTVRVAGELDMATAPALGAALDRLAERAPALVVVELSGVTFLGSAGLGVLVQARRDLAAAGSRLVLAKANDAVLRLFQITHLESAFEFDPPRG
ncbi:STAS domain-containing protein [Jatrophihabitans sp. YIM 134969]